MLQQAKATATYELILEKTVDAQAAFTDDTKTLAEQQLILSANLKEVRDSLAMALIPFLSKAAEKTIEFFDAIKDVSDSLKSDAVLAVEGLARSLDSISTSTSIAELDQYIAKLEDLIDAERDKQFITKEGESDSQRLIDDYRQLIRSSDARVIAIGKENAAAEAAAKKAAEAKEKDEKATKQQTKANYSLIDSLGEIGTVLDDMLEEYLALTETADVSKTLAGVLIGDAGEALKEGDIITDGVDKIREEQKQKEITAEQEAEERRKARMDSSISSRF